MRRVQSPYPQALLFAYADQEPSLLPESASHHFNGIGGFQHLSVCLLPHLKIYAGQDGDLIAFKIIVEIRTLALFDDPMVIKREGRRFDGLELVDACQAKESTRWQSNQERLRLGLEISRNDRAERPWKLVLRDHFI